MSVARMPQLGSNPVALHVKVKASKSLDTDDLAKAMQELYRKGEFTDVTLRCAGQTFVAHRVILASQSNVFKEMFSSQSQPGLELRVEVTNPEAVKLMLDYLYMLDEKEWAAFNPRTQAVNQDVLQLAEKFQLHGLTQQAMHWLSQDLTTGNVLERLAICDDFGLSELSDKILQQLTNNRAALAEVAHSQQITNHPTLMQSILKCAAGQLDPEPAQQPKTKRSRKA